MGNYHYMGSQQEQIGGDGSIPGSTWTTAHDDPSQPGYISLGPLPAQEALIAAWNELQAVPSYVEQQARAFSSEE